MTKSKMPYLDIIPDFDVLEWKREIQEKIYQETKDMTSDELLEYLRKGSERFREERKLRQMESATRAQT